MAAYPIHLLYEQRPDLSDRQRLDRLETTLASHAAGTLEHSSPERISIRSGYTPPDGGPAPLFTLAAAALAEQPERDAALAQSWWWPEARAIVPRCTSALELTDELHDLLDPALRIQNLKRALVCLLGAFPARALYWPVTAQFLEPDQFVHATIEDGFTSPVPGAVNVRFYRLEPETGDDDESFLMDTLGLSALGLFDLQCHFRGLDPDQVSRTLYETACYLFDRGPVLRDGDSVQGPTTRDRWLCREATSMAQPERQVVALDPGFPFGASR